MKTGTLSRGKAVQGGMRADKVVEKDEHGNEVIGGREGRKSLFGLVPGLELLVEALNEVVGDVIVETLHADMLDPMQCLDRHSVGRIAVAHNGLRSPHRLHRFENGKSLRAVPVTVKMETKNKAVVLEYK